MSLIICSNAQEGYSELVDGVEANRITGLQDPASFHNALSNTITLPPMSKVGVVSAKIFRKSDWEITRMMRFFVLFDELLLDGESLKRHDARPRRYQSRILLRRTTPSRTHSRDV